MDGRCRGWISGALSLLVGFAACGQEPEAGQGQGNASGRQPAGKESAAKAPTDSKDQTPSDFARFVPAGDGGHFDTAITTYRNDDGVQVRLFAAVHIADARVYEELQERFAKCDALLYELVGPEDYRPKKGERGGGFISMLQTMMKSGLELEFQLDGVDYSPANFVHADMTPAEFEASMEERGESLMGMMVKMMLQGAAMQGEDEDGKPLVAQPAPVDLVAAFRNGEGRHQLRLMLASQLEQLETISALGGDKGSTLLEGRNEKCLEVLQREIAAGKKDLGIYYGAAHLPHLEHRLVDDLGFHKVDHEWLVAWDCTKRPDPKFDRELFQARRTAKGRIERLAKAVQEWGTANGFERAPTFEDLGMATQQDPWGNAYRIAVYARMPYFDVHSLGQDGEADTDDDLHSATPSQLRRMKRGAGAAPEHEAIQDRIDRMEDEVNLQKAQTDVIAIANAAKLFRAMHGRVPELNELTTPDEKGQAYIDGSSKDPWGNDYVIRARVGNQFDVVSHGPDGKPDTDDDVSSTTRTGQRRVPGRSEGYGDERLERLGEAFNRAFDDAVREATTKRARADLAAIRDAAKLYRVRHGSMPTMALLTTPDARGIAYVEQAKDPWGHDYVLRPLAEQRFEVRSCGPDGKADTPDDIVEPPVR